MCGGNLNRLACGLQQPVARVAWPAPARSAALASGQRQQRGLLDAAVRLLHVAPGCGASLHVAATLLPLKAGQAAAVTWRKEAEPPAAEQSVPLWCSSRKK